MTNAKLNNEIEIILGASPGSIKGDEKLNDLGNWDSLAVVMLMAAAAEKFDCELTGEAIASCATIADLALLIERQRA